MTQSELRRARDVDGEVVRVDQLNGGMVELWARLPHIAQTVRPGEFAQLRAGDGTVPLLRRPFSVAWAEGELCSFVFAPVGEGTRRLAERRPGDPLRALGPLGNGFTLAAGQRALCVSGGLGCAPFPLLAQHLRGAGAEVTILSGASTAVKLYPAQRFQRGDTAIRVIETTDDGTAGRRGLVTELAAEMADTDSVVYACGPNPMLIALSAVLEQRPHRRSEMSLEAPMGCGYGTCLGCVLPGTDEQGQAHWLLCCRDGPVVARERVDWGRLAALPPAHVA